AASGGDIGGDGDGARRQIGQRAAVKTKVFAASTPGQRAFVDQAASQAQGADAYAIKTARPIECHPSRAVYVAAAPNKRAVNCQRPAPAQSAAIQRQIGQRASSAVVEIDRSVAV